MKKIFIALSFFSILNFSLVLTAWGTSRYWVGGTSNWDATAGTKWSATSGGVGGASVPDLNTDVFFDANSGSVTVTSAVVNPSAKSLNCTGFTGTLNGQGGWPRLLASAGSGCPPGRRAAVV